MARIVKSFRIEQEIWDRLEARSGNASELGAPVHRNGAF
mgnify:CR=1 FL=1